MADIPTGAAVDYLVPAGLLDARRFSFSHVSIGRADGVVHVSGQTAVDGDGHYDPTDDLAKQTRTIAAEISSFLGNAEPPATWIGVSSLLSPVALIEIEAVALVDLPR